MFPVSRPASYAVVHPLKLEGRRAWLKQYSALGRLRRMLVALWNLIARRLDLVPLMSPPPHSPAEAKHIERRRLEELHARGAHVPRVLGEGREELVLSDLGDTLSRQLKLAREPGSADRLVDRVAGDLARLHRDHGYLGQAFPRNITVSHTVGFIDFEEDPLEMMTLAQAQARDWIMFTVGVARHYRHRHDQLALIIGRAAAYIDGEIRRIVFHAANRLAFLERLASSHHAAAIAVLRQAFAPDAPFAAGPAGDGVR